MPKYAELVYNGFWFSPEREALQALVDKTQEFVTGTVRLKLYKVGAGGKGGGSTACTQRVHRSGVEHARASALQSCCCS
jgi:argininosuccinate synthase